MKHVIDERMTATKRDKPYDKQISIDRNMTIVYIPTQFTVGTSYSRHPSYPKLGHRVIYINTQSTFSLLDHSIPFGKVGTVTGIYKGKIEVMFDEAFIGATSLYGRCYFFRGAMVDFLEIFNLSDWKPFVNTKKDALEALSKGTPLSEWDGQLDQYKLLDEILSIRQECTGDEFGDYRDEHGGAKVKYTREKKDGGKKNDRRKGGGGKKHYSKAKEPKEDDGTGGFFAEVDDEKKDGEMTEEKDEDHREAK
jgi:hypothetical protein